jgi:hypothetical protein
MYTPAPGPSTKTELLGAFKDRHARDQQLTTDQGIKIPHIDDSPKAGPRGPVLR